MIPNLLEKKIIDAIDAKLADIAEVHPYQVFGAWQKSAIDLLKNEQEVFTVATIGVVVGTQGRSTFSTGSVSFVGTISMKIRAELDRSGTALLEIGRRIETLLRTWQGSTYQKLFADLDVEGFEVGDISFAGGNAPVVDFAAKTILVEWPFTISGSDAD